jgi:hypothetical protein
MTNDTDILEILTILTEAGKTPRIIGAMDIDGNEHPGYPRDYAEMDTFLAEPIVSTDIDGNPVSTYWTYENIPTFAGWKPFDFVPTNYSI